MLNISDVFQALGGSNVVNPDLVFIGQFLIWFVVACFVAKFFSMAFQGR